MSRNRFGSRISSSLSWGIASSGRSAASPPGRMKAWFIRNPVMVSKIDSTSSRSRKPKNMADIDPSSMPPVASATRWLEIRLSSINITLMTLARSGRRR